MRKITIYSTKYGGKVIETAVTTWGDLKKIISNSYDLSGLVATESKNKTTLESSEAILPEGDFILFLRPKNNKEGNGLSQKSFKELRQMVKDDSKLKDFLVETAGNWTQLSTENLRKAIDKYLNQTAETVSKPSVAKVNTVRLEKPVDLDEYPEEQKEFVETFYRHVDTGLSPEEFLELLLEALPESQEESDDESELDEEDLKRQLRELEESL